MTARVERTRDATHRAVCKEQRCRAANGDGRPGPYWRSGHLTEKAAHREALVHNRRVHGKHGLCDHCSNVATRIIVRGPESRQLCDECGAWPS